MRRVIRNISLLVVLTLALSCDNSDRYKILFSYKAVITKEFSRNIGKIVPLTIEKAVEMEGDFSQDGKYFYYSSNRERGNYDIYMRQLSDVATVRVTSHPSRDSAPVISPDGKSLAFVSTREDPEGDVYVLDFDPDDLLKEAEKNPGETVSPDSDVRNCTQYQEKATGTVLIIRDSSPAWSPDGKRIAWSSSRGGTENIWTMKSDGSDKREITSKGGMYPRFSPDGKKIVFVSYRDSKSNGDVYTVDLQTMREKRITDSAALELYPCFGKNANEVIYSVIEEDTNSDGKIDLKDRSFLMSRNILTGLSFPLTQKSMSSFASKWVPFGVEGKWNGVIIYSDQQDENININIIPETGIIPKKNTAEKQYELANDYIQDFDDSEKYLMALETVYYFFRDKRDSASEIYISRALRDAVREYRKKGDVRSSARAVRLLKDYAVKKRTYASILLRTVNNSGSGTSAVLAKSISEARKSKDKRLPYLLEDLAGEFVNEGNRSMALSSLERILREYPKYREIKNIHMKISVLRDTDINKTFSDSMIFVLNKGLRYQRFSMQKNFLRLFRKERNAEKRLSVISKKLIIYRKEGSVLGLLHYLKAETLFRMNKNSGALAEFNTVIKLVKKNDYLYYLSNVKLAEIAARDRNSRLAEKHYSLAVNRYSISWKDRKFGSMLEWLINYYETAGERAEESGNYKLAVSLYENYSKKMSRIHRLKRFETLYNKYGARSHVLYINALSQLKSKNVLSDLIEKYKKDIPRARIEFDKAFIYGLSYLYTMKGLESEENSSGAAGSQRAGFGDLVDNFSLALEQINWAVFFDDTFVDPLLLKTWIYQYMDMRRSEGLYTSVIDKHFPARLLERNIDTLEKALDANDEIKYPQKEGNLYLQMANNYFLLLNYPAALRSYEKVTGFKKKYSSRFEEALLYFHRGYCFWQDGKIREAEIDMSRALDIYRSVALGKNEKKYRNQIYTLYRYFALFSRIDGNYKEALSWYRKILNFSAQYSISVDRARYYQEIAECYRLLGDTDSAAVNLMTAHRLLKKYPDDEKAYKLKFTLFGVLPFSFFDLGPDSVVIGENRIFSSLDTRSKKLLNLSLLENINVSKKNYSKAISYLENKILLLKEKDYKLDVEALVCSYNNLAYYRYLSGDRKGAIAAFKSGRKLALKPGSENLKGAFTIIMNLSGIYAGIFENRLNIFEDPLKEVSDLISDIKEYRADYEKKKYDISLAAMEDEAKATKKKVTEKQKQNLRFVIADEASMIYSSMDTAKAILQYYQCALMKERIAREAGVGGAYKYYKQNKEILSLYMDSERIFSKAIEKAEGEGNYRLMAKLLLNLASCYIETGEIRKAYSTAIEAREVAASYRFRLVFDASVFIGNLLVKFGSELEGADWSRTAEDYYKKAVALVEENPIAYSSKLEEINNLYNSYISLSIEGGHTEKAFALSEKKYRVAAIILTGRANPEFFREVDRKDYQRFLARSDLSEKKNRKITRLLLSGSSADSPEVQEIDKEIRELKKENVITPGVLHGPSFEKYVKVPDIVSYNVSERICKFFNYRNQMFVWVIEKGRVSGKKIPYKKEAISSVLKGKDKLTYVILNETALDLVKGKMLKSEQAVSFIPSVDYLSGGQQEQGNITSVLFTGKAGDANMLKPGMPLKEGVDDKTDVSAYSVIVDSSDKNIVEAGYFLRNNLKPSVVIKNFSRANADTMKLIVEAGTYSGAESFVFTWDNGSLSGRILKLLLDKGKLGTDLAGEYISVGVLPSGNRSGKELTTAASDELDLYNTYRKESNTYNAKIHLARWYEITLAAGVNSEKEYLKELSMMEFIDGNYDLSLEKSMQALALVEKDSPAKESFKKELGLWHVYLLLNGGAFAGAEEFIKKNPLLVKTPEYAYFRNILDLLAKGSYRENSSIPGDEEFSIDESRLRLLLSQYEYITGFKSVQKKIISSKKMKLPFADSEFLRGYMAGCVIPDAKTSPKKMNRFISLLEQENNSEAVRNRAVEIISKDENGSVGLITANLVLQYLQTNEKWNEAFFFMKNLNEDKLLEKAFRADARVYLGLKRRVMREMEKFDEALAVSARIAALFPENSGYIFREENFNRALILFEKGQPESAVEAAQKGITGLASGDRLFADFSLLLAESEILLNRDESALARINALKSLNDEDRFTVRLLKARAELKRLLKLKKASEADGRNFRLMVQGILADAAKNRAVLEKVKRYELLESVLDNFVNYRMRTGHVEEALIFSDIKSHVMTASRLPGILDLLDKSRVLKGEGGFSGLYNGLSMKAIQKKLSSDTMLIYSVRNGDDIFFWFIGNNFKRKDIIAGGYARIEKLLREYRDAVSRMKNVFPAANKITDVFSPVMKYITAKQKLIFVTDRYMEEIPFELLGKKDMLVDSHRIYFMSSLLGTKNTVEETPLPVYFTGSGRNVILRVEKAAAEETGVMIREPGEIIRGTEHSLSEVSYRGKTKTILFDGRIKKGEKVPSYYYLPIMSAQGITAKDFALYNSSTGISATIVNNAYIHDINNPVFVENLYTELRKSRNFIRAFDEAIYGLRNDRRFRHPSYWSGIRLYLNGFER